ncbi:hypothetical protein CWATWH0402_1207 [Crocosphaera watsonii WH 0402]|uniref:Uncharacterized protein n=4 Tax=Crocosphaera watsonii TaxID=263511 RepID=T2JZQ3_CROWT|nr:hypothetical protein CWATWH0003_0348 [Crocosphaera watsonii WH 0003]CCQ54192.1 hypothetical protein CWATWH0005_3240 [Crocosphaera watsonii WH 0005]CCQ63895.1 hypothetical protein CWATWH0401_770 [Crocosphaera watsonii WH 0401]CCQ70546.1 hypothetical protein CWATWH0402_1207 [Crocosphaera watsonii WH 0402]
MRYETQHQRLFLLGCAIARAQPTHKNFALKVISDKGDPLQSPFERGE